MPLKLNRNSLYYKINKLFLKIENIMIDKE